MKITRETLLKIIQEEYAAVHELGPATGHEPGTAPLKALQEIIAALAEVAGIMKDSPSDRPADEFAGYLKSISEELQAIFDEFHDIAKRPGHLDLPEGQGPNTTKTDFPAGAASEYPKMLDSLYDEMKSYEARYGKALPNPKLMEAALDAIVSLSARLKRLEESLY